jgi:hypothetical protein
MSSYLWGMGRFMEVLAFLSTFESFIPKSFILMGYVAFYNKCDIVGLYDIN